jgi:hypothetical protein
MSLVLNYAIQLKEKYLDDLVSLHQECQWLRGKLGLDLKNGKILCIVLTMLMTKDCW